MTGNIHPRVSVNMAEWNRGLGVQARVHAQAEVLVARTTEAGGVGPPAL